MLTYYLYAALSRQFFSPNLAKILAFKPNYLIDVLMKYKFWMYLFFILCLPVLAQAAIYQKIQRNGSVYFSDTLTENARLLRLKPINTYSTSPVAKSSLQSEKNKLSEDKNRYKKFSIIQPHDQETFQNQREITVTLQIDPDLQAGDKVMWFVDGKSYQQSTNTQVVLKSLDRGKHTLQAKLLDENKQELMTTALVVFYVHYAMVS